MPKYKYSPKNRIPPGETIKETISCLKMRQKDFIHNCHLTKDRFARICNGESPINLFESVRFEHILGVPASFWLNLSNNYQKSLNK